jgi:hypothetical protein
LVLKIEEKIQSFEKVRKNLDKTAEGILFFSEILDPKEGREG